MKWCDFRETSSVVFCSYKLYVKCRIPTLVPRPFLLSVWSHSFFYSYKSDPPPLNFSDSEKEGSIDSLVGILGGAEPIT